ncbi:MAG TPA: signal peptide peptidase SppA, partial [Planctomycetota bacterium]|nr:signal peptide peptidase SppA [Planctomycetota bacterium]
MHPIAPLLLPLLVSCQDPSAQEAAAKKPVTRLAEIRVKGPLEDAPEKPFALFGAAPKSFRSFLRRIERVKDDADVKGLVLRFEEGGLGLAKSAEVRRVLDRVRGAGKKVHARVESLGVGEYLVACGCDEISLEPAGDVILPGLRLELTYLRDLLDKIGVVADVVHIGEYKTAFENFYLREMSPAQKESLEAILDDVYGHIVEAIAKGRHLTPEQVKAAVDTAVFTPTQARARKLVDAVEYEDEFKARLAGAYGEAVSFVEDYGKKERKEFDFEDMTAVFQLIGEMFKKPKPPEGDKIALVYANGMIVTGKSGEASPLGGGTMGSRTMVEAIREAAEDDSVKAIVMRVDSPGGSGLASDEIWREVVRAKGKKPFVVSMADVAGSGGYYISMGATAIVAEPTTITGSIGVVAMKPVLGGLYEKIGANPQSLQRGRRAGLMTLDAPFSGEERDTLRKFMEAFYGEFVGKVAEGRRTTPEKIDPIARGRIWSGRRAVELGLVDRIGGLDDAIALAKEKAGLDPKAPLPLYELPKPRSFSEMLEEGGFPFLKADLGGTLGALEAFPAVRERTLRAAETLAALA